MKSKKLIIILSVLAFITVLIVLNSTLFTLQTINVNWLTTKYELESIKDYELIEDVELGESIFLVKKDEISASLEKKYPFLQVVGIETKFPNKIVVHTAERESLYAIKLSDDEYAILDEKGKVLRLTTSSVFAGSDLGAKPIKISFESLSLNPEDFVVGEMVKVKRVETIVSQLSLTMRESSYTPTTSKGVFVSIDVRVEGETETIFMQTRNGMVIELIDGENYTTDKFLLGLTMYNQYHQEGVVSGTIMVLYSQAEKSIIATYTN